MRKKLRYRSVKTRRYRRPNLEALEDRVLLAADLAPHFALDPAQPSTDPDVLSKLEQQVDLQRANETSEIARYFLPPSTHRVNYDGYLSDATPGEPLDIATQYLVSAAADFGLTADDVARFVVTDNYVSGHTGVTHVYLQQTFNDLPIANANININITAAGEVINVGSSFLTGLQYASFASEPSLTALVALEALSDDFGWDLLATSAWVDLPAAAEPGASQATSLAPGGVSREAIAAELQYVPISSGDIELAWRLNVQTIDGQHWYDAHVSALDGELLGVADWASNATYNVFAQPTESPGHGGRTAEVDPQDTTASPFGWHDTNGLAGAEFTTTQGNNVSAYADRDDNNSPDTGSAPDGGAGLVFDFSLNLSAEPNTYQPAAVTNLFYWNNVLHDVHYQYGFDEVAGNFQVNNYGNGGLGGDSVRAEAQDGADINNRNNANMFTPPDGQNPRMQMFLWSTASPEIDGDFDNGIIVHEFGHGVSNRLTGGPANAGALNALQSGGMGEGWSDWHALMFSQIASDVANDGRGIGTYALNQSTAGAGIRSQRYSYDFAVNDHTFGDIVDMWSVHDIGETWAATLWDLNWALIDGSSLDSDLPNAGLGFDPDLYNGSGGNNLAMQLIMDGMKLQPVQPTFLDARDAILAADMALSGGANETVIWTVFARRGMGFSADDGGDADSTSVTEAFDLPAASDGLIEFDQATYEVGDTVLVTLRDSDLAGVQSLSIESDGGDVETVVLTEQGAGVFRMTINTVAGAPSSGDGMLQVAGGDIITVTYVDADDGSGGIDVLKTDTADVLVLTNLFVADFSDGGGNPDSEGFTLSGGGVWHLSTGRGTDPGHSADDSFYFGSDEGPTGGGTYGNNANGTITSPIIDLAGALSPIFLEFTHFLQVEDYYDNATVSVFDGSTTTEIAGNNTMGLPDSTVGFEAVSLDLTAFAGEQIQVLFHFDTDSIVTYEGWYVDDVTVRGLVPDSGDGVINFSQTSYEVGDTVLVSLRDGDLAGDQTLSIESDGGDVETVILAEQGAGVFQGTITTVAGSASSGDGTLQVAGGDIITVTYIDADDGGGGSDVVKIDTADVLALTNLFVADFSDDGGNPNSEGFTLSGGGVWHLSTGRGTDSGHSADDSFYFGSGEGASGGGAYGNDTDGTITSPVIDLSEVTAPIFLEFNHFLEIEDFYDNATVSIFDGSTTIEIAGNNTTGLPDSTGGFEAVSLDLTAFAGEQIQVLFHFDADYVITYEGWYVDDVTVRGVLPITGDGVIQLDQTAYEVGDSVVVTLRDNDLSGAQSLSIESDGGDVETIVLADQGAGVFLGMISTVAGPPSSSDGVLQVAGGDIITVTYIDADDGSGGSNVVKTDIADVGLTSLFAADFSDDGGNPDSEGFTLSGGGEWHLSTGRGADPGHSADDSFYFGSGERPTGGGAYEDNSAGTVTSPIIDLSEATSPIFVEFTHFLQIEGSFDNATVSVFDGSTTTQIAGNNTTGLPNSTDGFEAVRLDISSFAGEQIQLLFHFDTNASITFEGWYVDDVTVRGLMPDIGAIGETGQTTLNDSWKTVTFENSYNDPVVIAQPPSFDDGDPSTVRIRNVTSGSFEMQIDEWDYLDGNHADETVSYLVVEKGTHVLSNGTILNAGTVNADHNFTTASFPAVFDATPLVLAQSQTLNGTAAIVTRQWQLTSGGFQVRIQEQQIQTGTLTAETIGYVALEIGNGSVLGLSFDFGTTDNLVTDTFHTISFSSTFASAPLFLAGMQTYDGPDPSALRYRNLTASSVQVFVEEETSADSETIHTTEVVGFAAFSIATTLVGQPILAVDDVYAVEQNASATTLDVLVNDAGVGLSVLAVSQGSRGGDVSIVSDQLQYTPAAGFVGQEALTYTMTNGSAESTGTVIVTVGTFSDAYIDFDDYEIQSFNGPRNDVEGIVTVGAEGASLHLVGNLMKAIDLSQPVTPQTLLEFDFRSSIEGEVHAIGTDLTLAPAGVFKVHGTQGGGYTNLEDYAPTAPDFKHYQVYLGDIATGDMTKLWFMNDHDVVDPDSESYFANVRLFEDANRLTLARDDSYAVAQDAAVTTLDVLANDVGGSLTITAASQGSRGATVTIVSDQLQYTPATGFVGQEALTYTLTDGVTDSTATVIVAVGTPESTYIDFDNYEILSYHGPTNDVEGTASVEADGAVLHLQGNLLKAIAFQYVVSANTVLEFDFRSPIQGEVHAVGTDRHRGADGIFKVYGTQSGGFTLMEDYAPVAPDYHHYQVRLGDNETGTMTRLWFMNDHDVVNPDSEGYFANVRISRIYKNSNPPDQAADDIYSVDQDAAATMLDVLSNDTGTGLTITAASQGSRDGSVAIVSDQLQYIPATGFVGQEALTYTMTDGVTESTATVIVKVGTSDDAYIDFDDYGILSYGGPTNDVEGVATVEAAGASLHLQGNLLKAIELSYVVTSDTVLEFDFRSPIQGEVHAVGTDLHRGADGIFKVYGTQFGGYTLLEDYAPAAPDYHHYQVRLGDNETGTMTILRFQNDHDVVDPDSEGYFANVRIYEEAAESGISVASSGSSEVALLLPWKFGENSCDRVVAKSHDQPVVHDPVASSEVAIDMILGGLIPPSTRTVTDAIDQIFAEQDDAEAEGLLDDELLDVLP